ncbi:MAG: DUF711 family protein [Anaerolineales bacterium]|uniref:DUF711 family protein n=1 Tax=Candidatus Villigracilis proximus TaxID=3140683 RepID=UPI0031367F49|nr:DUF711 family protein [Anaerolineales bacterium]
MNPKYPLDENALRKAGDFLAQAKSTYEAAGYEVQTTRLATIPFPVLLHGRLEETPLFAQKMSEMLKQIGVAYAALGPALIEFPQSYEVIPEAISASENIFFGGVMADKKNGISLQAIKACAKIMQRASTITADGFSNLRFAALANVRAGAPFFPAAYHDGDVPAFAIATEAADLAVNAFTENRTLDDGRRRLISEIEKHGQAIAQIANTALPYKKFVGIDFSFAPFPDDAHSLGRAVENLGVPKIGLHGSLAAAAILTEAVDRADFPHTGFSGFMQPVLEDSVLAARGRRNLNDKRCSALFCGVRHRTGYSSTGGRYDRRTDGTAAAGSIRAGDATGQAAHCAANACSR